MTLNFASTMQGNSAHLQQMEDVLLDDFKEIRVGIVATTGKSQQEIEDEYFSWINVHFKQKRHNFSYKIKDFLDNNFESFKTKIIENVKGEYALRIASDTLLKCGSCPFEKPNTNIYKQYCRLRNDIMNKVYKDITKDMQDLISSFAKSDPETTGKLKDALDKIEKEEPIISLEKLERDLNAYKIFALRSNEFIATQNNEFDAVLTEISKYESDINEEAREAAQIKDTIRSKKEEFMDEERNRAEQLSKYMSLLSLVESGIPQQRTLVGENQSLQQPSEAESDDQLIERLYRKYCV